MALSLIIFYFKTLILIKKFEINELNQSNGLLKQAEIFCNFNQFYNHTKNSNTKIHPDFLKATDSRLTKLIGELKETLHFLNNNFAKIIGTLDKPQQDEANRIEMNIKYQKYDFFLLKTFD